jgi:hypothetical protein
MNLARPSSRAAMRLPGKLATAGFALAALGLVVACGIDPTSGVAGSGGFGSLGTECTCANGRADCEGVTGQCATGLSCMKSDFGPQYCTHACPCPLNYVCKAANVPGARLACFKQL